MDLDTHVYCTKCANFKISYLNDIDGEPFCIYEKVCNFWNFEDSKLLRERPYYIENLRSNDLKENK